MSGFGPELGRWMQARGLGVRELHRRSGYSAGYITQLRQGRRNPSAEAARDLDDALGAGGALAASAAPRAALDLAQRSPFVAGGTPVVSGLVPDAGDDALASVLTDLGVAGQQEPVTDLEALAAAVDAARASYQDCRYAQLDGSLPGLIVTLNASCAALGGNARERAHALCADAHHVAAGLMLKRGDLGLAALAADRSMRAALASGDPVAVGASARIVTHALMSGGHLSAAVDTAVGHAARLDRDLPGQTPRSLSVYGALLLRGAVAAALADGRGTAAGLLDEAGEAARRLGSDGNYCWTAFGPVNIALHRVSIAVTLGDAGTAIDVARTISIEEVTVTERKTALLIDTARALLQRGRHEGAYRAVRRAHEIAPEEVAGRAAVRVLVRDLAASAPVSVRRDATGFAASIGATA
jgi:transcriptional regulator with XRE-family HTH domain